MIASEVLVTVKMLAGGVVWGITAGFACTAPHITKPRRPCRRNRIGKTTAGALAASSEARRLMEAGAAKIVDARLDADALTRPVPDRVERTWILRFPLSTARISSCMEPLTRPVTRCGTTWAKPDGSATALRSVHSAELGPPFAACRNAASFADMPGVIVPLTITDFPPAPGLAI